MVILGEHIRKLREEAQQPLRIVAAYLDTDPAILSKIERGKMKASREQVLKLAGYFKVPEKELLKEWLSDKVLYELQGEDMGLEALKMAEAQLKYNKRKENE